MSQRALSATLQSIDPSPETTGDNIDLQTALASVKDNEDDTLDRNRNKDNFSTDRCYTKFKLTLTFDIIANKRSAIENCARKEFIKYTE